MLRCGERLEDWVGGGWCGIFVLGGGVWWVNCWVVGVGWHREGGSLDWLFGCWVFCWMWSCGGCGDVAARGDWGA